MNDDKKFVAMATKICMVCGIEHSHNAEILIHKNLRNIPEDKRCTGYGLCEEHSRLEEEGYIALVEADPNQTIMGADGTSKPENAYRTGRVIHIKREAAQHIFGPEIDVNLAMVYIDIEAFDQITAMMPEGENNG